MSAIPVETFYVEAPSVPAGMTIDEYRRSRPRRERSLRRNFLLATLATVLAGGLGLAASASAAVC